MNNIICECGHGIEEHSDWGEGGCTKHMSTCDCGLTPDAIEARYWARKCYRASNENFESCKEALRMLKVVIKQRDMLQIKSFGANNTAGWDTSAKIDEIIRLLRTIVEGYFNEG